MKIKASINDPSVKWSVRSQDPLLGINYGIAFFATEQAARNYANEQYKAGSKHIVLRHGAELIKEVRR